MNAMCPFDHNVSGGEGTIVVALFYVAVLFSSRILLPDISRRQRKGIGYHSLSFF
jgi:hypothetical protein